MKYQLVALFDYASYNEAKDLQHSVCRKFRIYKNYQNIYVPLMTLNKPALEKFEDDICKVLDPYKHFNVKITNTIGLVNNDRHIVLSVDNSGYLSRLSRNLAEVIRNSGVKVESFEDQPVMQLPVAISNYHAKNACAKGNVKLFGNKAPSDLIKYGKISKIELWKLTNNNKRSATLFSYSLRPY